jgi:hypothetical protein
MAVLLASSIPTSHLWQRLILLAGGLFAVGRGLFGQEFRKGWHGTGEIITSPGRILVERTYFVLVGLFFVYGSLRWD